MDGKSRMNFTGYLKEDLAKTVVFFVIKAKHREQDKDYQKELLRSTTDTCSMSEGIIGNILVKRIIENIQKFSNLRPECPQKSGFYFGWSVPVMNGELIPGWMIVKSRYEASVTIKSKPTKLRPMIHLVTIKLYGLIVPNE